MGMSDTGIPCMSISPEVVNLRILYSTVSIHCENNGILKHVNKTVQVLGRVQSAPDVHSVALT